jgi:hypothetical protein
MIWTNIALCQDVTIIAIIATAIAHNAQQQNNTLFKIIYYFYLKLILYILRDPNLCSYSVVIILIKTLI